jgi:hypothetical protein
MSNRQQLIFNGRKSGKTAAAATQAGELILDGATAYLAERRRPRHLDPTVPTLAIAAPVEDDAVDALHRAHAYAWSVLFSTGETPTTRGRHEVIR